MTKKFEEFEKVTDQKMPLLALHFSKYLMCLFLCITIFSALTGLFVNFTYSKMRPLQLDFDIKKNFEIIAGIIDELFPWQGKCSYSITSSSGKLDHKESICDINCIQLYHFTVYVLFLYHLLGCVLIVCHVVFAPLVLCSQSLRG